MQGHVQARQRAEAERERLIAELQQALANVKTLSGLIPICASCKKIRDDQGYWTQIETYLDNTPTRSSATAFAWNACESSTRTCPAEVEARLRRTEAFAEAARGLPRGGAGH